jgi:hypothetical protein
MTHKTWHRAAKLANIVSSLRDKVLDERDDYGFPPPIVPTTIWGGEDEAVIQNWNGTIDKTSCFDFGILNFIGDVEK